MDVVTRPLLLDLFCGAGGAAQGYYNAGFDVVGVDIAPQPHYPFDFIQADALDYLSHHTPAGERCVHYDAMHISPPCQRFTAYRRRGEGVGDNYADLIDVVRGIAHLTGLPWVIENVPGAPMRDPVRLCGSSFGLDVRRSIACSSPASRLHAGKRCDHAWQTPRFPCATNRTNLRRTVEVGVRRIPLAVQQQAMGIDWMTGNELSQAIPPAYTEYIGAQLLAALAVTP